MGTVVTSDALQAEAEIFDTLELTRLSEMSDIGTGTIDALHETAELLCRAYPSTPATVLRDRTKRRLQHVIQLLGGRSTLDQHRKLVVVAGWLAVLLGCLHYDLGEREEAEAAYQWAKQAGVQRADGLGIRDERLVRPDGRPVRASDRVRPGGPGCRRDRQRGCPAHFAGSQAGQGSAITSKPMLP